MNVPEVIELRVLSAGRPLVGAWVELTFPMPRKNPFHSCHGPSDEQGRIVVPGEAVLRWARLQREFALMDYDDLESSWRGTFRARVLNGAELERAADAAGRFADFVELPEGYRSGLEAARRAWTLAASVAVGLELTSPLPAGIVADLAPRTR